MALKSQHLTTLQRDLDDTAWHLSFRAPIVATPGMLNLTLLLGVHLEHRDNLGLGLHYFDLGQHTSAAWKVLKARADQHQAIMGGATPYVADAATLMAPYSVSLSATLAMARGVHARMRLVLATLFGTDHPTALVMKEVNVDIL